jgi:predicted RNA-binding Zn-ribbon protein involved in translation (DUF1610 family)
MHCPNCGTLMNRHAEKPIRDTRPDESMSFDTIVDGVITSSIHYCPGCGKVEAEVQSIRT